MAILVMPTDLVARHVEAWRQIPCECDIKYNPDYGADYDAKRSHCHIGCFFINANPVG